MATIVRDDLVASISTGGGSWISFLSQRFYGGSAMVPSSASNASGDTGQYGSLTMTFHGTSVAFIGNTPNALSSQWAWVSIDGGPEYNASYMDSAPPSARQWFQSPTLSDGTHTINISRIAGTSIDFVVITAGQNTSLSGETLIVDDGDPSISYTGNWGLNTNPYTCASDPHLGLPYGNSTHQTNSAGASATFRFSGSNIAVWGVSTFSVFGNLSVTYTMDGYSVNTTYPVNAQTSEYLNGMNQIDYHRLFYNNTISPGDHTLEIKVVNSWILNLELDYITYIPSFNTLALKPTISQTGSSTPTPKSAETGSTSTPTSAETGSTPTPKSAETGTTPVPKAAIAGGVVGGVILLVLLALLFLWRRRISKPRTLSALPSPGIPSPQSVQPFVLAEPTSPFNAEAAALGEKTSPRLASPHQPGDLFSASVTATTRAPFLSDSDLETGILAGGLPHSRMRLQGLMQAFIREFVAGGHDNGNPGFGEIAQLAGQPDDARRDVDRSRTDQAERPPPPAYEIEDRQDE